VIPVAVLPVLEISVVVNVALLIAVENTTVNVTGRLFTGSLWLAAWLTVTVRDAAE
jgi:hypothetical protein